MSSMGKQKYIFAPSNFGASISTRERALNTAIEAVSTGSLAPQKSKAGRVLTLATPTFAISASSDPIMSLMGYYWAIDGVGGTGQSGDSRTVKKVSSIISGATDSAYGDYPLGTANIGSAISYAAPVEDTQLITIDLDMSAINTIQSRVDEFGYNNYWQYRFNIQALADIYTLISSGADTEYESVDTSMSLPLSDLEISVMNSDITTDYAVIDSEYNFYSQDYESLLSDGVLVDPESSEGPVKAREKMLPNLALGIIADHLTPGIDNKLLDNILRFNSLSNDKDIQKQSMSSNLYWNGGTTDPSSVYGTGGYPQRLKNVLSDSTDNSTISKESHRDLKKRMKNIIIDHKHINLIQDTENKRENFPFYVDLQFSPDNVSALADAIIESKLMDEFMIYLSVRPDKVEELPYYEATSKWDFQITENHSAVEYTGERLTATETTRKSFWLSNFLSDLSNPSAAPPAAHFSTTQPASALSCDILKNKLYSIVLEGKVDNLASDLGTNSMKDVFDDQPSHSDTVAYRIAKYNHSGTHLIQNIYIPNSTSTDMMRYIDTQVKYGKMYTYRIFAYQAVQAVKYSYSDVRLYSGISDASSADLYFPSPPGEVAIDRTIEDLTNAEIDGRVGDDTALPNAKLQFNAKFKSDIKIIEVPLYSQKVRILDSGPLSPEVQIIPLKDSPDTIHIMLNNRVGREDLDPIILVPESDTELFTTQAEAQRLVPGNKMTFESEDRPSKFQIFRTETRPTEWSDFGDNLHLELDTAVSSVYDITTVDKSFGTNNYAHAAAVRDNVEANTKYYYTFRTVDVHGFISNPTEIYQVELVNNDGTTYLLIEAVDFALKVPKQSTRHFRRYLKIAPKITQVMVDTEKYDSAWDAKSNGMNLGVQDIPVWGKEFKIIIRSKKTGREAHLYTTFNQTHNKTTTELGDPTVEDSST